LLGLREEDQRGSEVELIGGVGGKEGRREVDVGWDVVWEEGMIGGSDFGVNGNEVEGLRTGKKWIVGQRKNTHNILGLLEDPVQIILRFPYSWYTVLVVAEELLEGSP
jgi:hypothetical protein